MKLTIRSKSKAADMYKAIDGQPPKSWAYCVVHVLTRKLGLAFALGHVRTRAVCRMEELDHTCMHVA